MNLIGYQYDADNHCEKCTLDYAREVPYSEYVFGEYRDEDIAHSPGIIDLSEAIDLGVIHDSENNAIHPLFDTDEWYANDIYEGNESATLNCSDCGEEMDTWSQH